MTVELYIFSFIIIAYGFFTTLAVIGINKLNQNQLQIANHSQNFYSIVVSARNEENNMTQFLNQINALSFCKQHYELILIDDASTDKTIAIAEALLKNTQLNYKIIKQAIHQGKKQNCSQAIAIAKGNIIITTDADVCHRDKQWLTQIDVQFNAQNCSMLVMPVDFENTISWLASFQIVENIALTAITAGYCGINQPFLCNGANLAFKKDVFIKANGYQNHLHISSGEDVFLLEDFKQLLPNTIQYGFNKQLIVKTKAQQNVLNFFAQRIRWAYKAKYNNNKLNLIIGLTTMLANLIYLALFVAIAKQSAFVYYLSIFALTKLVFDFLLLFLASSFLGRSKYMLLLVPFECIYWLYALTVGLASLFIKPKWKGIKIK